MNKLGILGWPLSTTYSPTIHELLFDLTGLDGSYHLIKEENISSKIISKINDEFLGYNVTIPHKEKILSVNENSILSNSVKEIGASNTVINKGSTMYLYNTDFSGFKTFLDIVDHNFGDKSVLILGHGGSAKAIAYCLKLLKVKYYIVSRSATDNTIPYSEVVKISKDVELIVNTTPIGMPPYENTTLPLEWSEFQNLRTVINLGYGSKNTFLDKVDNSVNKYDGLGMLICQAIESFNIWTSAGLSASSIYGEVLNKLESIND